MDKSYQTSIYIKLVKLLGSGCNRLNANLSELIPAMDANPFFGILPTKKPDNRRVIWRAYLV